MVWYSIVWYGTVWYGMVGVGQVVMQCYFFLVVQQYELVRTSTIKCKSIELSGVVPVYVRVHARMCLCVHTYFDTFQEYHTSLFLRQVLK